MKLFNHLVFLIIICHVLSYILGTLGHTEKNLRQHNALSMLCTVSISIQAWIQTTRGLNLYELGQ